jgi:hypothetical protein
MASTKRAYGICDVCGFRYKYNQLRKNSYGLLVCSRDWDGGYDLKNHPQNKTPDTTDREFIKNPRPPNYLERNISWEAANTLWEETETNWNNI